MCYWAWALRHNYDWDSHFALEVLVLKLRRMEHYFVREGYHDPACSNWKPKMKSLRLALKLGDRLLKSEYGQHIEAFERSHGTIGHRFERVPDTSYSTMRMTVGGIDATEAQMKAWHAAWAADERREERDRHLFYKIVAKYSPYWWD